jgi:phosphatidylinositol alpha-mannosyltransferase
VRIGIVTEEYWPAVGPIADQVQQFAREARRLGHAVKVFTGAMPDLRRDLSRRHRARGAGSRGSEIGPAFLEGDVIRLARSRPLLMRGGARRLAGGIGVGAALRSALAGERLDVLHVHAPLSPVLPLLALHHATGPVVGTFHHPYQPGILGRLFDGRVQRYLDRLDAAVVTSRASLASLPERIRGDLRVIPPGVDVEHLARGCRIRRYQDGRLNVLFAGAVEPRCGLDVLLAAVDRAGRHTDIRLLVLGDGPLRAHYRARVPRGMEEDVVFVQAPAESLPDWFATADVCCVPGAAPVQVLEAMAAGRAVLAADVEQNRELVRHGREGELLPSGDAGTWARCLIRLSQEPIRGAAYGERGRTAAQRHGWPGVAREILNLYRGIGVRG